MYMAYLLTRIWEFDPSFVEINTELTAPDFAMSIDMNIRVNGSIFGAEINTELTAPDFVTNWNETI